MWGSSSQVYFGEIPSAKAFSRSNDGLISVNHFPWAVSGRCHAGGGRRGLIFAQLLCKVVTMVASVWGVADGAGGGAGRDRSPKLGDHVSDPVFQTLRKGEGTAAGRAGLRGSWVCFPGVTPAATRWGRAWVPWCLNFCFSLQTAPTGAPSPGGRCP